MQADCGVALPADVRHVWHSVLGARALQTFAAHCVSQGEPAVQPQYWMAKARGSPSPFAKVVLQHVLQSALAVAAHAAASVPTTPNCVKCVVVAVTLPPAVTESASATHL